jgi:hypothetical protein
MINLFIGILIGQASGVLISLIGLENVKERYENEFSSRK